MAEDGKNSRMWKLVQRSRLQPVLSLGRRNYASKKNLRRVANKSKQLNFIIPSYISVNKLSNVLNCRSEQLVKDLTRLGFPGVTQNYILSREYVELILQEYNYELPTSNQLNAQTIYNKLRSPANPKLLRKRPPVVTIMGHVDHGKTTIIDYLRKSSVVSQEHGGITQHIGAFQVITPISKKKITFLDTPGHAAFLKMRERGANVTDIIIIVVSIEDSIMPQTVEAIKHAKNSGNETIIAITKIDKIRQPKERKKAIERVTTDLIAHDIPLEQIGGDVQVVPLSARSGENMDLLEESVVLLSDVMDISSEDSNKVAAEGWILESQIKKTVGNVATVLLKKGCLQKGNILVCGNTYCKVRNLLDSSGKSMTKVLPADAVEILGWKELPEAGDQVIQAKSEAEAKKYNAKRIALLEVEKQAINVEKLNLERGVKKENVEMDESTKEGDNDLEIVPKEVNFIIKADVSGSAEAIKESISSLGNDEVKCNVISSSVGLPSDSDLEMAQITNSKILCFNLGNLPNDVINNRKRVDVRHHTVIYKLIDEVIKVLVDNLRPIYETKHIAQIDLREVFEFTLKKKVIKIAGCRVESGKLLRNSTVQVLRGDRVIFDGKLATLKQGKEDVLEVTKGNECGMTFENGFEDYEAGDKIIVYEKQRIPRHL